MRSQPAALSLSIPWATSGIAVAHRELDRDKIGRQPHGLQPLPEQSQQQRPLLDAVDQQRRAVLAPDHRVLLRRLRRAAAQDPAVQDGQPDRARNLDHARIRQELGEVPAHGRRRRRVGRAQVDEQHADLRRAIVREARFGAERGQHGCGVGGWRIPVRERRMDSGEPCGGLPVTGASFARHAASAFAACARTARCTGGSQPRSSPLTPSACRAQRYRSKRSTWRTMRPSRNANSASMRLTTFRPVAEYVYVATQCARPVAASASMSEATTREVLAARAEHAPHRGHAGRVEARKRRVGKCGVRSHSRRPSPRHRGGRAPRRSARSAPRWAAPAACGGGHQAR